MNKKRRLALVGLALVALVAYLFFFGLAAGVDMPDAISLLSWFFAIAVAEVPGSLIVLVTGVILVGLIGIGMQQGVFRARNRSRWWVWSACGLATVVALSLLVTDVPRRLAFRASRSKFEAILLEAPSRPEDLRERIGFYRISVWSQDDRGGTFFLLDDGSGARSTWTTDVGFAFRPNALGTPFGDEVAKMDSLCRDWYYFELAGE